MNGAVFKEHENLLLSFGGKGDTYWFYMAFRTLHTSTEYHF